MTRADWALLGFTAEVAAVSTALILLPGLWLAFALAQARGVVRAMAEAFLSLPLVLPPTAVGLVLLELFRRDGPLGTVLARFDVPVLFTPLAVVLASMVMSFPLLVRAARAAFQGIDPRLLGVARTLGATRTGAFFRVALPVAAPGVLAGVLLAFSRALGEFGATIIVAGNIPGRTQTLALALFQRVQLGQDASAWRLALLAVVLSLASVGVTEWLTARGGARART